MDFVRHSPKGYSFGMKSGMYFVELEESAREQVVRQLWGKLQELVVLEEPSHGTIQKCQRLVRLVHQAVDGTLRGYYEDVIVLIHSSEFLNELSGWQHITTMKRELGIYERAHDIALSMGEILAE